jgi:FixJ family two-component response regulator
VTVARIVHIVDDDESFRQATARLLRSAGYTVAEYQTADDLLDELPTGPDPACLLLDVRMPNLSGPELQQRLEDLGFELPIVFLTGFGDIPTSVRAIKHGAEDFLTKPVDEKDLFDAIERAMARSQQARAVQRRLSELQLLYDKLTPREREVLEHVVLGRQSKQIAFDLGTTVRTVKAHRMHIMQKLNAKSVIELVSMARTLGILPMQASPTSAEAVRGQ